MKNVKMDLKRRDEPGSVGKDQHAAAVEEAVLELSRVARPVAEGQLTQAVTQTCSIDPQDRADNPQIQR